MTTRAVVPTLAALFALLAACGGHESAVHAPAAAGAPGAAGAAPALAPPPPEASGLGPRPAVPPPAPFVPASPLVFTATHGITVWLMPRPALPIVSCALSVPSGASSDPPGKAGVAYATAAMLDEGAGTRGALDLARAIEDTGASIGTSANPDASFATLTVLKADFARAFALFADVVARPRLDPREYQRFHSLWENALLERERDPDATARVVYQVAFFGAAHPYGHPSDGTARSARAVTLADVRRFYHDAWRPDRATLACAGDVDRAELTSMMDAAFASWRPPATPPLPIVVPPAPAGPRPRAVVVDHARAPQVVVAVVGQGPAASNPEEPALARVNEAIGGSFASRLNQDLREKRGYTYGARSLFSRSRGPGMIVVLANVVTDKAGDALASMLGDLSGFAQGGLTPAEVERSRALARTSLVDAYSSVQSIAGRLATDASLGLDADHEGRASRARDAATREQLDALAREFYDPARAMIVLVGPKATVLPALDRLGIASPEIRDAQGEPVRTER